MNLIRYMILGVVGLGLYSHPALAHPGHGLLSFFAGLVHPLTGVDHLLAALAVGVCGASFVKKADFKIPFGFITGMVAGILAGQAGLALPFYEQGIAFSLFFLGVCLAFGAFFGSWKGVLLVACFGACHGSAHGVETVSLGLNLRALAGLVLSTAMLHAIGMGWAVLIRKTLTEERAVSVFRCLGAVLVGAFFVL